MRIFVDLIPPPIVSARAIAAVVLDDAGVKPDATRHGVTIVETEEHAVALGIVDLIEATAAPKAALVDAYRDYQANTIAVLTDSSKMVMAQAVDNALACDVPVVVVARHAVVPDDLADLADPIVAVPPHLRADQIARVIDLVTPLEPGELVDVTGIESIVTLLDIVKAVRRGFSATDCALKLRKIAKHRRVAAEPSDEIGDAVLAALKDAGGDKPVTKPVMLRDLSGYGEAKTWGLQLAADLAAYKKGEIQWADVDCGILLSGPPGCGKTFYANALANECGVKLFATSYSEWHTASSGDTVQKSLSKLFKEWREAASKNPIIVFVDEIDTIGVRGTSAHHSYWFGPIINSWLAFLDGAEPRTGIVAIGATNLPDAVDGALRRPGRLDRHVVIPPPTLADVLDIIKHHAGDLNDARAAAIACRGRSPAAIAQAVRDARRIARRAKRSMTGLDVRAVIEASRPERSTRVDRLVAVHEAGHAVVAATLGVDVWWVDLDNAHNAIGNPPPIATRAEIDAHLRTILAGRAADELWSGGANTGAAIDLHMATGLARSALA